MKRLLLFAMLCMAIPRSADQPPAVVIPRDPLPNLTLAAKGFLSREMKHVDRGVWEGSIPAGEIDDGLEYFIEVKTAHRGRFAIPQAHQRGERRWLRIE